MAIRHNRRTIRTEIEFSVAGFIFTYVQKCFGPLMGAGAIAPPMDPPLVCWREGCGRAYATHWLDAVCLRWQEHATLTYSYTDRSTAQLQGGSKLSKEGGTPHSDVCPPTRCKAIHAGLESLDFKEFFRLLGF